MQTYTPKQLRSAVESGGVHAVTVTAKGPRFYIEVKSRTGQGVLTKARSHDPRLFANPVQAFTELRRLGVQSGAFDTTQWTPEQREAGQRPDRSEALKRTHQAAAHDRWFRANVDAAVAKADDPATHWIDHEDAQAEMDTQRQRLIAERDYSKS